MLIKKMFSIQEKMYIKKMLNPVTWAKIIEHRLYIKGYIIGWMHIGDIMYPIDGEFTTTQVIAISRYMDIAKYYESDKQIDFGWQTLFTELMHKKRKMTEEEIRNGYMYFERIIKSLDKNGIIPQLGYIRVNRIPTLACDGTHRLGYYLYHQYYYIPCLFERKMTEDDVVEYRRTPRWLCEMGMSDENISEIYIKLKEICKKIIRPLVGIVEKKYGIMK